MKKRVILALCIAILMSASAMAAMQCSVVPFNNCPQKSIKVIGMTSLSNDGSHASIPSDQANALVACCSGVEGLSVDYSREDADIYLTEARNAHVSRVEGENGIKIKGVSCGYFNDCNENACVFSISSDRDAHISDCEKYAFSRKLCCTEGKLAGEELPILTEERNVPEEQTTNPVTENNTFKEENKLKASILQKQQSNKELRRVSLPAHIKVFLKNFLRGGMVGSFLKVPQ
ncbi:MAG: hypothetical protein PHO02_04725 [Candidatus Nanoarchaeia archaeon]|nr:hypothetical protein [Candidatus Nanoarchaeia archaeon]